MDGHVPYPFCPRRAALCSAGRIVYTLHQHIHGRESLAGDDKAQRVGIACGQLLADRVDLLGGTVYSRFERGVAGEKHQG